MQVCQIIHNSRTMGLLWGQTNHNNFYSYLSKKHVFTTTRELFEMMQGNTKKTIYINVTGFEEIHIHRFQSTLQFCQSMGVWWHWRVCDKTVCHTVLGARKAYRCGSDHLAGIHATIIIIIIKRLIMASMALQLLLLL